MPSSTWNVSGKIIATALTLVGSTAWLIYWSFQDFTEPTKDGKKKHSKKKQQSPLHSKNDDRKGISPADLQAVLETKVTKDGDCVSCREKLKPSSTKKKSPPSPPSYEGPALPGIDTPPLTPVKDADTSLGSTTNTPVKAATSATSANESWDKLKLPPTPKKNARTVPPTPSNSLSIMYKNKEDSNLAVVSRILDCKSDALPTAESDFVLISQKLSTTESGKSSNPTSDDCRSDTEMEKTQEDL